MPAPFLLFGTSHSPSKGSYICLRSKQAVYLERVHWTSEEVLACMAKPHAQSSYIIDSYRIVHAADISGMCLVG